MSTGYSGNRVPLSRLQLTICITCICYRSTYLDPVSLFISLYLLSLCPLSVHSLRPFLTMLSYSSYLLSLYRLLAALSTLSLSPLPYAFLLSIPSFSFLYSFSLRLHCPPLSFFSSSSCFLFIHVSFFLISLLSLLFLPFPLFIPLNSYLSMPAFRL